MAKTIDELKSAAAIVRDATEEKENTAWRVGGLLLDLIDALKCYQPLLESGVNIKTVNGKTIIGSGDLRIIIDAYTKEECNELLKKKVSRVGDSMEGDLNFLANASATFSTSDGGLHFIANNSDDILEVTTDNSDKFTFANESTPKEHSSAVVVGDTLFKALKGLAPDAAYYVDTDTIEFRTGTLKVASQQIAMAIADIVNGNKLRDKNIEAKADTAELHVVLASMGGTLDNVDNTGDSAIMYVADVGDIYYSEGKEHLFFKKSETETIDLGTPSNNKIYANAMTKRLYIWRGGTWRQCSGGGGATQIDAYTKAESDARYLRGEVIYEDYYYPNMGKTTDNVNFTDSTEILQPTKFLESYTDANGVSWNDVFECASFPDWFDFAEKSCYPYGNGNSVGYLFIRNYVVDNNELSYDFYTLQNNNIGQKLPYYASRNGLGLKKIDATHFKVYNTKEGTTEFTAMNKANVDCSLFAFSPLTYCPIYDIDDCNIVRITLTGNIQSPSRYSSLLNSSCDVALFGYTYRQVLYGDEYVEIEIDKNNNRWRQIKSGYSMFYRSNYSQNWSANKPESYESECHCLWSKIPSNQQGKICMINKKICYAFSNKSNPLTILQMGCKIKIEKLA